MKFFISFFSLYDCLILIVENKIDYKKQLRELEREREKKKLTRKKR